MRVTLALLVLVAGCLGDGGERASTPEAEALSPWEVAIANFSLDPQDLNISRGQAVTWANHDDVVHHLSGEKGNIDSGRLDPGDHHEHMFDEPGRYPYRCLIHPAMVGTVHVT